jgi:uncharacterized protein (UPF0305 family)
MLLNKLNWEVAKVPLQDMGVNTGFYATKRLDNNTYLSTIGKNYPVLQNSYLLEMCQQICASTGYELYLEEPISGGKQVLISLKCAEVKVGDDKLISQISVANSFTGTTSVGFSTLDLNIRCANQFSRVLNNSAFRFNHDSFVFEKLNEMIKSIKLLNEVQEKHYFDLNRFVSTPFSKDLAIKAISKVLDIQFENNTFTEDTSTKKKNIYERFINSYEEEEKDLGNSLWSLTNAATNYVTHVIKQPYHGTGLKINNDIYNLALQYA